MILQIPIRFLEQITTTTGPAIHGTKETRTLHHTINLPIWALQGPTIKATIITKIGLDNLIFHQIDKKLQDDTFPVTDLDTIKNRETQVVVEVIIMAVVAVVAEVLTVVVEEVVEASVEPHHVTSLALAVVAHTMYAIVQPPHQHNSKHFWTKLTPEDHLPMQLHNPDHAHRHQLPTKLLQQTHHPQVLKHGMVIMFLFAMVNTNHLRILLPLLAPYIIIFQDTLYFHMRYLHHTHQIALLQDMIKV